LVAPYIGMETHLYSNISQVKHRIRAQIVNS
jgi:hypothetical protein